jgi:hypothetical protein
MHKKCLYWSINLPMLVLKVLVKPNSLFTRHEL